jgi:hypothetical protein
MHVSFIVFCVSFIVFCVTINETRDTKHETQNTEAKIGFFNKFLWAILNLYKKKTYISGKHYFCQTMEPYSDNVDPETLLAESQRAARPNQWFWLRETQFLLYTGVLLLNAGFGVLVYEHIDTIGHAAVIAGFGFLTLVCFGYCWWKRPPYSTERTPAPNLYFDYILLLGCLLFLIFIGYWQYQYQVFGRRYGLVTFVPTVVFFAAAYRFDNRLVLGMALAGLAAWFGVTATPRDLIEQGTWDSPMLVLIAALLGVFLIGLGMVLARLDWRRHFEADYIHAALHLICVGSLSGIMALDRPLVWLPVLAAGVAFFIWYARSNNKFYLQLLALLYGYIGFTYTVFRYILPDAGPYTYFGFLLLSAIGLVIFLMQRIGIGKVDIFVRAARFIFGGIALLAIVGILALFFGFDNNGISLILLLIGIGTLAFTDKILLQQRGLHNSGLDEAGLYGGLFCTLTGFSLLAHDIPTVWHYAIWAAILKAATMRYADRVMAFGAFWGVVGFVVTLITTYLAPQTAVVILPWAGVLLGGVLYFFTDYGQKRPDWKRWHLVLTFVMLLALLLLCGSVNYGVVCDFYKTLTVQYDETGNIVSSPTPPLFFWLTTFAIPVFYWVWGLLRQHRMALWAGIIGLATAFWTVQAYQPFTSWPWMAVLTGGLSVLMAYVQIYGRRWTVDDI